MSDNSETPKSPNIDQGPEAAALADQKLQYEIQKLEEEIRSSKFESSLRGRLLKIILPAILASGTFLIAIMSWRGQVKATENESMRRDDTAFTQALEWATDTTAGPDRQVAGIYALSPYWHKSNGEIYETRLATTLSKLLFSGSAQPNNATSNSERLLVQHAAAIVIGDAIDTSDIGMANSTGSARDHELRRIKRILTMLYGESYSVETEIKSTPPSLVPRKERDDPSIVASWKVGVIWRLAQGYSHQFKNKLDQDTSTAISNAIRHNWECLKNVHLADLDLTEIHLYRADCEYATFDRAILHKADLHDSSFISASFQLCDLSCANLKGADVRKAWFTLASLECADLNGLKGHESIKSMEGCYIAGIQNAPKGFREWAILHGATESRDVWLKAKQDWDNLGK